MVGRTRKEKITIYLIVCFLLSGCSYTQKEEQPMDWERMYWASQKDLNECKHLVREFIITDPRDDVGE